MNENITFMFGLIKSVVTESEPPKAMSEINWKLIHYFANRHNIKNIMSYAVLKGDYDLPENIKNDFLNNMYTYAMVDGVQTREAERVFAAFEKYGLEFMPVKGVFLKKIYPSTDMRRMGDIDILIREEKYEEYKKAIEEVGFTFNRESNNEYIFNKKNLLTVELHRYLITPGNDDMFAYYGTGWRLAKKESEYMYRLSKEDEYVYMIVHFAKHYRDAGIGLRPVIDIWMYKNKNPDIDMDYVFEQLEKMNLHTFAKNVFELTETWFGGVPYNKITSNMTEFILENGEYGTSAGMVAAGSIRTGTNTKMTVGVKMKKYLQLIFPDRNSLKRKYPVLVKYPIALPFCWFCRWIEGLKSGRDKIKAKQALINASFGENVEKFNSHMKLVGLDIHNGRKN